MSAGRDQEHHVRIVLHHVGNHFEELVPENDPTSNSWSVQLGKSLTSGD